MSPMSSQALQTAVGHLNAPTAGIVTADQLEAVLQAGALAPVALMPAAEAALAYLFVEVEPRLIARCAYESGSDIPRANALYRDTLAHGMPRVPAWESAVEHLG